MQTNANNTSFTFGLCKMIGKKNIQIDFKLIALVNNDYKIITQSA